MTDVAINPFDQASRHLLRRGGAELLAWLLRIAEGEFRFVRWLDTRLTIPGQPERYCDTIAHVARQDRGGEPWACAVEFQVEPDEAMFGRLLVYQGQLWLQERPTELRGDRFWLQGVTVNLTGACQFGQRMLWNPGAETTLFPIVWDMESLEATHILEQIDSTRAPMYLLPYISLMKGGGEPATIRRWLEVASKESDPYRKADFAHVVVFADLTGCQVAWEKALEGFNVVESVTVNKWKAEVRVKDIQRFLEGRFDSVPAELMAKIREVRSLDVLEGFVTLAAKAKSLEDFRRDAGL